jgi:Protein of unknown function (DUF3386)
MKLRRWVVFAALIGALGTGRAEAHFLFVRILPPAEGGRAAEVYFSELADAGDPRFLDKIAATQLWLQKTPGTFEPLTVHRAPDRLRAWVPASGSLVVVGRCDYGVLARPKQTPFLLRHFPKALAGNPTELNRMKPHGRLPLEVVATCDGDQLRLVALKDGQPVPRAEFVTVDASLANTRLTADAAGGAAWKPLAPGVYAVYTRDTRKESGEAGGKKYEEIRDFATVAFTWPLERTDADPAAVALFEEAVAARAQWHDFPGFSAQIRGNLDGRRFEGRVTIDAQGAVEFVDDAPDAQEAVAGWVQEQLESIVQHRLARPAAERARPVLRFAEARDDHPLGRLLTFDGGRFASSYRVKDRQILVVNRNVGKENFTITILENDRNPEGKYLPRSYVVRYWDAATGRLLRTETVQDGWHRVGAWDLPALHTVTTATDAGLSVRRFELSRHELLRRQAK